MTITHAKVSAVADGADTSLVRPSDWNADHTIASGTITEAMQVLADNTTGDVSITAHGYAPKAPNVATQFLDGTGAWSTPAGSATLDGITAAVADQAGIANADWNIVWNWQKTTDSEIAFTFGETAASTNGTSTSGVPNQVLLQLSTLAASTMSPLKVLSRGAHVFSVSPTTAQLLLVGGTVAAPGIAGTVDTDTGLILGNQSITFSLNGIGTFLFANNTTQINFGSATTASYSLQSRKSRGTVASPTVITTGDDLLTINGYGYVGGTNTYQEAARITLDSTGTISDSATGIGGIMRFSVAKVGAEVAEIMRLEAGTTTGGGWLSMDEADANPGVGDLAADDAFAIYRKADTLVFAHNVAGTMNYLTIPLDGTSTAWTQGTAAP